MAVLGDLQRKISSRPTMAWATFIKEDAFFTILMLQKRSLLLNFMLRMRSCPENFMLQKSLFINGLRSNLLTTHYALTGGVVPANFYFII